MDRCCVLPLYSHTDFLPCCLEMFLCRNENFAPIFAISQLQGSCKVIPLPLPTFPVSSHVWPKAKKINKESASPKEHRGQHREKQNGIFYTNHREFSLNTAAFGCYIKKNGILKPLTQTQHIKSHKKNYIYI